MAIETLLLGVGTATAKAVARIWIKSEIATDLSGVLMDQLAGRVPGILERRRASRQFEEMADRVAQQLLPIIQHEPGGLPDNEREAAILGVAQVIDSVQAMAPEVLFAIDLEPTALESLLRADRSMKVRGDLSETAQFLFDVLLRESCNYIVELSISMPQFNSAALVEILRRGSEIMERVDAALERLPKPALAEADADQEFDVRYRRHIARELDRLELFGLTLSETSARYELSIAYITLGASIKTDDVEATVPKRTDDPRSDGPTVEDDEPEAYLRVDDALARGKRHLIRGEAGSGKTTLLQWLAVTASRRQFEGKLEAWQDMVPFFLQLRRYANGDLPNPSQFLDHTASLISDVMPTNWVDRKLRAGEGLVLIDGVDELPEDQRPAAREWLETLLAEYPDCHFVITTRPPAVPENWLESAEFALFELLPMSLPDIDSFVQHWYDAARNTTAHDQQETEVLHRYQRELARVIRENQAIKSLATAPLLCAMLCALNRDRRTQLPKDRMELYRIALESLLDRRDVEREISQNETVTLGLREKETLLQDLAYWLILNDQTDVGKSAAIERVETRLTFMTSIRSSAAEVFRHLLIRSGLIREPVEGRIDFIHRTFQEYLGAARAVKEGNIPHLISHAQSDQWREVIILAAGHASAAQANELINGLIDRGSREVDLKHRLHLLGVACLETAVELEPDTILRVEKALRGALPPTNMTEARAVASAGPVAAPLLTQYKNRQATTVAACVRALCLIGGDAALGALREFAGDRRVTVTREIIRGWDNFDRETYAHQILAECRLDYGRLSIADAESLAWVHPLRRLRALRFDFRGTEKDFEDLPNLNRVTELHIGDASKFDTLDGLASCERLQHLRVNGGARPARLPRLADSLLSLELTNLYNLRDVGNVSQLPNLRKLTVAGAPVDVAGLAGSQVSSLTITDPVIFGDGSWLTTLANLENLDVAYGSYDVTGEPSFGPNNSMLHFRDLPLRRLDVWPAHNVVSLDGLGPNMSQIELLAARSLTDASALASMEYLQRLTLDGASALSDFSFVPVATRRAAYIDFEGMTNFSDVGLIAESPFLRTLNVAGTSVTDVGPLVAHESLRLLNLSRCPINSFDSLVDLAAPRVAITIDASQVRLLTPELRQAHRWRVMTA